MKEIYHEAQVAAIRGLSVRAVSVRATIAPNLEVVVLLVHTLHALCINLKVSIVDPLRKRFILLTEISLRLVITLVRVMFSL